MLRLCRIFNNYKKSKYTQNTPVKTTKQFFLKRNFQRVFAQNKFEQYNTSRLFRHQTNPSIGGQSSSLNYNVSL